MANRLLKPMKGCLEAGVVKLYGTFTTSTTGTIASSSCKGFTVTKTASKTGRYTITLADKYSAFLGCRAIVEGAADAAYTSGKGLPCMVRGVAVSAATPVLYLQFVEPETAGADAELDDGAKVYIELTLKDTSAY